MKQNKSIPIAAIALAMAWMSIPCSNAWSSDYKLNPEKENAPPMSEPAKEREPHSLFQVLDDKVNLRALLEVEAYSLDGYEDTKESDITLSTMELGVEAAVNEWVNGTIVLLWEEDDTEPVDLDEATITLGNTENFPLYLTAGKMGMPFGFFETNMVQDPLPYSLGDTSGSGVLVGFEAAGVQGALYTFKGDVREIGDNDEVNTFGASIGYEQESDTFSVEAGVDWINNISGSGALVDSVPEEITSLVAGIGAHVELGYGPVSVTGEYISALDEYGVDELAFRDQGAKPSALSCELAYTTDLFEKSTTFAVGYQQTAEAIALELPEKRYLGTIGMEIFEYTTVSLEYLHDQDYSLDDGGTGDSANQITLKLALEF